MCTFVHCVKQLLFAQLYVALCTVITLLLYSRGSAITVNMHNPESGWTNPERLEKVALPLASTFYLLDAGLGFRSQAS